MKYSGFPESFIAKSDEFYQVWSQNRVELLIRQDLRDISNIIQIGQVEILASFVPDRVGSPLSLTSLQEELDGSYTSIQRWMKSLSEVYYHFEIKPYSKSIPRSLKKEGKIYLYDWCQVENQGARFENLVALHLLKLVHYYNDTGQAKLGLYYLRNKDQEEVDFILLNKGIPLMTIEAKKSEFNLNKTYLKFQKYTKAPHFQIVCTPNVFNRYPSATVISFADFFINLP